MRRGKPGSPAGPTDRRVSEILATIAEEMEMVRGDEEQVATSCSRLRDLFGTPPPEPGIEFLQKLARLYAAHDGTVSDPVFTLLADSASAMERPWPLLEIMLRAGNEELQKESLELVCRLTDAGQVVVADNVLRTLADVFTAADGLVDDADAVRSVTRSLRRYFGKASRRKDHPLVDLITAEKHTSVRLLLAKLLDAERTRVPGAFSGALFRPPIRAVLEPYLDYTNAGFEDHLVIAGSDHGAAISVSLAKATSDFGVRAVRKVIALVGWDRANLGMRIRRFVRVDIPGSLPLMVLPEQALLFAGVREVVIGDECVVAVTRGRSAAPEKHDAGDGDPVGRFRALNIVHAELLGEMMDVAPLDHKKIERILVHMDGIVEDYEILFGAVSKEVRILPDVYQTLKRRICRELAKDGVHPRINAEATRLVQMFEDPGNLGEVRTIHGLKRYLHQKGLRLGLDLVDTSRSPNNSVDIVLIDAAGDTTLVQSIRYAEFETECELDPDPWLTYPIRIVVEGFTRQLLYGQRSFPDVNAFVFGNEVHYYLAFRNHPAFLRIDYSPPQRGGMIDLQYLGVSNYELDLHPGSDLEAIQLFFRRLEFDVKLDGTRIFVRYDKEISQDLGDLSEKAEALFRLVPHLMNVDWTVGSLDLDAAGKRRVAEHWAERFAGSGVLPVADILAEGGRHIVRDTFAGPSGISVSIWDGASPYTDRFSAAYPAALLAELTGRLESLGIHLSGPAFAKDGEVQGLLAMQRTLLDPLQEGLACGRVVISGDGLRKADPDLFAVEHPAQRFAGLLAGGDSAALQAIESARPVAVLERFVAFETVGFVGGVEIQRAELEVRGGTLAIYAARDGHGVVRMALSTEGGEITRTRRRKSARWRYNTEVYSRLWSLLLGANYVAAAPDPVREGTAEALAELRTLAACRDTSASLLSRDDRRLLPGVSASPGRVMGRAVFETAGHSPESLDGGILVAREIRPADAAHLLHAAGIVSTGGAVLSHAALLALQFGKPALVTDAEFCREKPRGRCLRFTTPIYEVEVRRRHGFDVGSRRVVERRLDVIREGDLIVLDADEGVVQILGQERDALALHEGFRMLDDAGRKHQALSETADILAVQALRLRARHILEKALDRLHDPELGAFAVEEISLGRSFAYVAGDDRIRLMSRLLENGTVGDAARERLVGIARILEERLATAVITVLDAMPTSSCLSEILGLWLKVIHAYKALIGAVDVLTGCGIDLQIVPDPRQVEGVGIVARERLVALREETTDELLDSSRGKRTSYVRRHLLRRIEGFDTVLGSRPSRRSRVLTRRKSLERADEASLARGSAQQVLADEACGYELNQLIGWKAANLAELRRLVGEDVVPPWFVVTDRSLSRMLEQRIDTEKGETRGRTGGSPTLEDGIREVLRREGPDNARKSILIRDLWTSTPIPEDLVEEVLAANEHLVGGREGADVALRSSSCDEDTETVTRAGEYDSFLHVRGKESVCRHLKLTWAGLWTERALHTRETAGDILHRPHGGVIIQRMIPARASGVMQTVNAPGNDQREIVVNAGLGLGEGVVSGLVATDMITIVKNAAPDDLSLRINYITNDKTTQVVLDKRRGGDTRVVPTLYHQRMRPALEYLELAELVSKALRLEKVYGYPLDLEFAVEGVKVWLLQARPIGIHAGYLRETLAHHPLPSDGEGPSESINAEEMK